MYRTAVSSRFNVLGILGTVEHVFYRALTRGKADADLSALSLFLTNIHFGTAGNYLCQRCEGFLLDNSTEFRTDAQRWKKSGF